MAKWRFSVRGRRCVRSSKLKARYGISLETYEQMLHEQKGRCKICKRKPTKFHVDHDHVNNKVRSLLCETCNVGLGSFKDSAQLLAYAAKYLKTWVKHSHR